MFYGTLLITIPFILYLIINSALGSFIDEYILFNMSYSSSTITDKMDSVLAFLNTTITSLAFIIMAFKLYSELKNKKSFYFDIWYLIYMCLTLVLIGIGGRKYGHYGMTIIPMLIYPYCLMYKFLDNKDVKKAGLGLVITAYLLLICIIPTGLQLIRRSIYYIATYKGETNIDGSYYEIVDYIVNNTEEDDLISVFGNLDDIYYLTGRESASKYSYQLPIIKTDKQILNEYLNDLKENEAKLVVFGSYDDYEEEQEKVKEFLEENYDLVFEGGKQIYKIKE